MSRKFGAFDPASTATTTTIVDTAIVGVVFYAPFDTDVNDDSSTGHGVTAQGNAAVSSAQSVFGGASLALDGNGDYLQIGTSSTFNWGTADFTIEAFINHTGIDNSFAQIFDFRNSSGVGFTMNINNSNQLGFYSSLLGGYIISNSSATTIGTNSFKHVAVVRTSGTVKMFIEGVQKASASHTNNYTNDTPLKIGIKFNDDNAHAFKGFIDDLRISKNLAVYATAFSVPTTAVGATEPTSVADTRSHSHVWNYSDIYKARRADSWPASSIIHPSSPSLVSLYIPGDTDVADASIHGHTLTATPGAAVSSAASVFGGASVYFDGGSYLNLSVSTSPATSTALVFGTGDFTLEYFINNHPNNASVNMMHPENESNTGTGYWAHIIQDRKLRWNHRYDVANLWEVNASADLFDNTFHHVAIVRNSGTFKVFIDGQSRSADSGTFTDSSNYVYSSGYQIGGHGNIAGGGQLLGYLDDFRITKHAVYTTAFTVPTAALGIQTFL